MSPTHTPKSTPKPSKPAVMKTGLSLKAKTPESAKDIVTKKTPKSATPSKRKKLSQEIDDQISDEEFEQVKSNKKEKQLTGKITPKKTPKKDIKNLLDVKDASDMDDDNESAEDDSEENQVKKKLGSRSKQRLVKRLVKKALKDEQQKELPKHQETDSRDDENSLPGDIEDLDPIRLFVNGLSKSMTMDILKSHFPDAVEVRIPLRAKTQKVIGFGFIEFKSPEICDAALEKMQGTTILDRTIQLFHAKKQSGKKRTMETKQDDFVGAKKMKMEDGDIKKKSSKKSKTKKRKATADK